MPFAKREVKIRDDFGFNIMGKYQLTYIGRLNSPHFGINKQIWGWNYVSEEKITIEQVRKKIHLLILDTWKLISTDPAYANYLWEEQSSLLPKDLQVKPDNIALQIAYWDENINRPLYPYLARVQVVNKKVFYAYADPETQVLLEPIIESFEDIPELEIMMSGSHWPKAKKG